MNLTFFRGLTRRNLVLCSMAMVGVAGQAEAILPGKAASPMPPSVPAPMPIQGKTPEWRILVVGDSQAQGLAAGFMRLYQRQPNVHVIDRSKIGTGLARNLYDWPDAVKKLVVSEHADVAVVMFGANDRPTVRVHGKVDPDLAAKFTTLYGDRVSSIASTLHAAKLPVVWVGHPQVRDPIYNQDMAMLNGIFAANAAKAGARFVPVWTVFAGTDGAYDAYGKGTDGETARLRADDGVHMTRGGYDVLAKYLQGQVGPK
jgi:hypothetical protein